jgi:N-acetylneuraminic acid mutarotase
MYVLGGYDDDSVMASVLKFDSTQAMRSQIAPMPTARFSFTPCTIGSDLYVFGGAERTFQPQASVFKFDTEANTWSMLLYQCECAGRPVIHRGR